MIYFRTSVNGALNRVIFAPRLGTTRGAKEIQRQLVYGYGCPFCRNAVLFAFLTPEKVSLRKYEESWVVSSSQKVRKIIPGDSSDPASRNETAYHIEWIPIPGRSMGLQRVRMKNHILTEDLLGNKEAARQPGTRCCPYVGIFSARRDLLIKDTILMGGFPARELADYNLPDWERFEEMLRGDGRHFFQEGIGAAPLVMVRSDWIDNQLGHAHWRGRLLPFKKPKQTASVEPEVESEPDVDSEASLAGMGNQTETGEAFSEGLDHYSPDVEDDDNHEEDNQDDHQQPEEQDAEE
jgi:hypothetical protein